MLFGPELRFVYKAGFACSKSSNMYSHWPQLVGAITRMHSAEKIFTFHLLDSFPVRFPATNPTLSTESDPIVPSWLKGEAQLYSRGSIGSLSRARTANAHSCTRESPSR